MLAATISANLLTSALGLATALIWGAADFAGGLASRRRPAIPLVALAHAVSLGVLLVAAAFLGEHSVCTSCMVWGAIGGAANVLALMCFYHALGSGPMGLNAAVSGLLTAAVPVGFAFTTEGWPSPIRLAGFAAAAVSIVLIAVQPSQGTRHKGFGLSLAAGLGFGVFLLAMKFAGAGGVWWPLVGSRLTGTLIAGSVVLAVWLKRGKSRSIREQRAASAVASGNWAQIVPSLAILAGLLDAGGNLLYVLATRSGRLDIAAVLASLYPAATILLAIGILRERTTRFQAVGMALAIAAVVLISL